MSVVCALLFCLRGGVYFSFDSLYTSRKEGSLPVIRMDTLKIFCGKFAQIIKTLAAG